MCDFRQVTGNIDYVFIDRETGTVLGDNVLAVPATAVPMDVSDEEAFNLANERGYPLYIKDNFHEEGKG
jgi:hypothetical protein